MHRDVRALVTGCLPRVGGSDRDVAWVGDEVESQLAALASPARLGARTVSVLLRNLPAGLLPVLSRVPGTRDYARLVRSLAVVTYLGAQETEAP